ncbi:MAG: FHA domain-containing protein [Acidobacteriota bacterium]
MAQLENVETAKAVRLVPRCLIGRSSACFVRVDDAKVSGEHAVVFWRDGSWQVQDLGSRNGTFVDGQRVEAGAQTMLSEGSRLALASARGGWTLVDASPPVISATSDDGRQVFGEPGFLTLPPDAEPEAQVLIDGEGQWALERAEGIEPAVDQQVVVLGGASWRLHLIDPVARTLEPEESKPHLTNIGLRFVVSADEEHVDTYITLHEDERPLAHRAHSYFVLTLARARAADERSREAPPSERGWRYQDELLDSLDMTQEQLYVATCRARQQLAELGVDAAGDLIERRRGSGQLRLGVSSLTIA